MAKKESRDTQPVMKPTGRPAARKPDDDAEPLRALAGNLAFSGVGALLSVMAVFVIGAGGVLLSVAWQFGPKVLFDRAQFASYTGRGEGRIVESWLALDVDIGTIKVPENWRASAKASPCAVVELDGNWGAPVQRAFCGTRLGFYDSYDLGTVDAIAPGVPFAWSRDERGFAVPEIRLSPAAKQYLAAHEPDRFMHQKWPAKNALQWLQLELDRPLDFVAVGWSAPAPTMVMAFDPQQPAAPMPLGILEARAARTPSLLAIIVAGGLGLVFWFFGMWLLPVASGTLLGGMAHRGRWLLAALPLLALPWWSEYLPRTLATISPQIAEVIADMLGGIDPLDRLIPSTPERATLAMGERLVWRPGDGAYADTFGRFRYGRPGAPSASPDAALAALSASVSTQFQALDEGRQIELLDKLKRDKLLDLKAVGLVFLPAVKDAYTGPQSSLALRRAARSFLLEWTTQPIEVPYDRQPGYKERERLAASVKDLPLFPAPSQ